jgi:hypothetical protein
MLVPDLPLSASLVAVTATVCCAAIVAGAVYKPPALMVPSPTGFMAQVTAVFVVFATVAVNCCDWPPYNVALCGVTLTETEAIRVIVLVPDLLLSAWLVAVTVTVCCAGIVAGAV